MRGAVEQWSNQQLIEEQGSVSSLVATLDQRVACCDPPQCNWSYQTEILTEATLRITDPAPPTPACRMLQS